jgi:hypothetical protein
MLTFLLHFSLYFSYCRNADKMLLILLLFFVSRKWGQNVAFAHIFLYRKNGEKMFSLLLIFFVSFTEKQKKWQNFATSIAFFVTHKWGQNVMFCHF